ncbi:sensory rhodopsin transducer [Sinorhizobium meliloti]|nr:sensory rhodopsin transducer [Sinorhizobium meliloti]
MPSSVRTGTMGFEDPRMTHAIGSRRWAIADGYIPSSSASDDPALVSHECACILNTGDTPAKVEITLFFSDREPAGPYRVTVAARRTVHLRFNDLDDPERVPRDTPYASLIESDTPIVVQQTRLDSRQPPHALLSTIAYCQE